MSPLTGGQKDTQPPKLIQATPLNASVNFTGKTIELKFDEFVQVKDLANQLVVTPQPKEIPSVEASGKKIIIKFEEALIPNTTYRLFFGGAIADMHEANVLSGFEYVFSTGSFIDSLFVIGTVKNAYNLKPVKDVIVGLYDKNESDSVVFKKKPLYITKTTDAGTYKLSYLPESSFKIFAFTDNNKNLMYDGGDERVAFNNLPVATAIDTVVNLKVFKEEVTKVFIKKSNSPFYGVAYVVYNKEQNNVVLPYHANQNKDIMGVNGINDTCIIYYKNIFDTLKVLVKHPDQETTDSISILIQPKDKFNKLKNENKHYLMIDLKPASGNRLDYFASPDLAFNNWMDDAGFDASKMILIYKGDSLIKTVLQLIKSSYTSFSITNKLIPNTNYELLLKKGAFKTVMGVESDSVKISFKTTEPSDYAVSNLKLLLPKKENYIVQLVSDKEIIVAEHYIEMSLASSAEQLIKFKNLAPGNYFVKVIEDKNQNKKWDTGSILNQKQPELIYFNAQIIKLLADWDSETEWKVD